MGSAACELTTSQARRLQLALLRDLREFCTRHGLTYYLAYGTLIGALRHRGYIPWDDDIDVQMVRDDYERFYQLVTSESRGGLPAHLAVLWCRDGRSSYPFMKLVDTRTAVNEQYSVSDGDLGIWIDIFPLERVPRDDRRTERVCARINRFSWGRAFAIIDPSLGPSRLNRLAKHMIYPVTRHLDANWFARRMDELARSVHVADSGRIGGYDYVQMTNEVVTYPVSFFAGQRSAEFEGEEFTVPAEAERVLEASFGNWRELPPESERPVPHVRQAWWTGSLEALNALS